MTLSFVCKSLRESVNLYNLFARMLWWFQYSSPSVFWFHFCFLDSLPDCFKFQIYIYLDLHCAGTIQPIDGAPPHQRESLLSGITQQLSHFFKLCTLLLCGLVSLYCTLIFHTVPTHQLVACSSSLIINRYILVLYVKLFVWLYWIFPRN